MHRRLTASLLCVATCLCAVTLRGEAPERAGDQRSSLVGTWKVTSMKINGQAMDLPDSSVTYKHVTPGGFTFLSFQKADGKLYRAGGGTWTLSGDEYAETIEYGLGDVFEEIKGGTHTFKCRIEGDTWHHTGKLAKGTTIDEVWTRVKPSEAPKAPKASKAATSKN
jgi:hypothetical protein